MCTNSIACHTNIYHKIIKYKMTKEELRILEIKEKLNKVGKGFCLAKWTSLHLNLASGTSNSCHHPTPHKIPLEELENPGSLHNTNYKKNIRNEMLEGKRPKECQYCWNVEDLGDNFISDRYLKSSYIWSRPHIDEISNGTYSNNPTYLEVMFSNTCNFKCSYCGPAFSSRWVEEINNNGSYPTSENFGNLEYLKNIDQMPIHHKEHNPYVDAFWKWWPEIKNNLNTMRITGGEPLLDDNTFKILDEYIENPNVELNLAINSNLGVPKKLIDKLKEKINLLEGKVKEIQIFTSVDTHGSAAEYSRYGLNYNEWHENLEYLIKNTNAKFFIMCTANIFSLENFTELLKDVKQLKEKYSSQCRTNSLVIDISILRYPPFLCLGIVPEEYTKELVQSLEYMKNNEGVGEKYWEGFYKSEIIKLERLVEFVKTGTKEYNHRNARIDFYDFVNEYDKRRGTNFLKTFPNLENFYLLCEKEKTNKII